RCTAQEATLQNISPTYQAGRGGSVTNSTLTHSGGTYITITDASPTFQGNTITQGQQSYGFYIYGTSAVTPAHPTLSGNQFTIRQGVGVDYGGGTAAGALAGDTFAFSSQR